MTKNNITVEGALQEVLTQAEVQLRQVLTELNPWKPEFASLSHERVQALGEQVWAQLRELMPKRRGASVLQQAWAARFEVPRHLGLLYRAGLSQGDVAAEARRLRALTVQRWESDRMLGQPHRSGELIAFLLAEDPLQPVIPNLGGQTAMRGSIRLRYRLASLVQSGVGLGAVVDAVAAQPAASSYQRRVELHNALKAAQQLGRKWRRLGEFEVALLERPAQKLLINTPAIWPLVLADPVWEDGKAPERIESLQEERSRIEQVLATLMTDIRRRCLERVDDHLAKLPDTALVRRLCMGLKREPWELQSVFNHPTSDSGFGPWMPMSPQALARLQEWAPQPLPAWWAMSAQDFAQAVLQGQFTTDPNTRHVEVPTQDLVAMRRAWPAPLQAQLLSAGYAGLLDRSSKAWMSASLPDLVGAITTLPSSGLDILAARLAAMPDARAWIAYMAQAPNKEAARLLRDLAEKAIVHRWKGRWDDSWGRWIASALGCVGWAEVEDVLLSRTTPLKDVVAMFAASQMPLAPVDFQAVVAKSLHHVGLLPPRPLELLKAWMVRDPLAARALADHAPLEWVLRLARNVATPVQALDVFMAHPRVPAATRRLAWRNRLSRTQDPHDLSRLATQMPAGLGRFQAMSHWLVAGSDELTATALVMAARRDGARLEQLSARFGAGVFTRACAQAARQLAATAVASSSETPGTTSGATPAAAEPPACDTQQTPGGTPPPGRLHREAAILELIAVLGAPVARSLVGVLSKADFSAASGAKLDSLYTTYTVPKKNGGLRQITAPHPELKRVQRAILNHLLQPLGAHESVYGFVSGRSIADNAAVHVGQPVVVNADIANCFASVRWPLVLATLRRELAGPVSDRALGLLVDLTTFGGALPVGAPCSPALLNLVLRRADEVLHEHAGELDLRYTRYADDLTFSGGHQAVGMLRVVERLLRSVGLALDPKKTNVYRRGRSQLVTGLVVNDQVSVPRAIRKRLRAAVHHAEQGKPTHWAGEPQDTAALAGRLAFVAMVHAAHAQGLQQRLSAALPAKEQQP